MLPLLGSKELLEDVHQRDLCIGCGACVELCPYFKNYRGKTSQLFPCTLPQGRCFAYCPKVEVDLEALSRWMWSSPYDGSPLGVYREIVAAKAGAQMPQAKFQGGGTVSALMTWAMRHGQVDAAALAAREGLMPAPRLVTRWQEVASAAGAQFMASPTLAGVNRAVREGYRKIGVVGTPCQMLAVAQMRTNPLGKAEHNVPVALAIGLFCNWALDTRQLADLLTDRVDVGTIHGMDIPPPPANVLVLETDTGRVEVSLSEVKPLIPHTCFTCLDMTSEFADLSVGMYEGRPGWNTLVIRSETGARLVADATAGGFLVTEPMPAETIQHLSRAAAAKKERSLRILIQRGLINTADGIRSAVRMPRAAMDRILPSRGGGSAAQ
jgi:coenzyme F420 hydrogenase subunit beta